MATPTTVFLAAPRAAGSLRAATNTLDDTSRYFTDDTPAQSQKKVTGGFPSRTISGHTRTALLQKAFTASRGLEGSAVSPGGKASGRGFGSSPSRTPKKKSPAGSGGVKRPQSAPARRAGQRIRPGAGDSGAVHSPAPMRGLMTPTKTSITAPKPSQRPKSAGPYSMGKGKRSSLHGQGTPSPHSGEPQHTASPSLRRPLSANARADAVPTPTPGSRPHSAHANVARNGASTSVNAGNRVVAHSSPHRQRVEDEMLGIAQDHDDDDDDDDSLSDYRHGNNDQRLLDTSPARPMSLAAQGGKDTRTTSAGGTSSSKIKKSPSKGKLNKSPSRGKLTRSTSKGKLKRSSSKGKLSKSGGSTGKEKGQGQIYGGSGSGSGGGHAPFVNTSPNARDHITPDIIGSEVARVLRFATAPSVVSPIRDRSTREMSLGSRVIAGSTAEMHSEVSQGLGQLAQPAYTRALRRPHKSQAPEGAKALEGTRARDVASSRASFTWQAEGIGQAAGAGTGVVPATSNASPARPSTAIPTTPTRGNKLVRVPGAASPSPLPSHSPSAVGARPSTAGATPQSPMNWARAGTAPSSRGADGLQSYTNATPTNTASGGHDTYAAAIAEITGEKPARPSKTRLSPDNSDTDSDGDSDDVRRISKNQIKLRGALTWNDARSISSALLSGHGALGQHLDRAVADILRVEQERPNTAIGAGARQSSHPTGTGYGALSISESSSSSRSRDHHDGRVGPAASLPGGYRGAGVRGATTQLNTTPPRGNAGAAYGTGHVRFQGL